LVEIIYIVCFVFVLKIVFIRKMPTNVVIFAIWIVGGGEVVRC
jgi:hypothetical protein